LWLEFPDLFFPKTNNHIDYVPFPVIEIMKDNDELFPWDFIEGITSKTKLYNRLTAISSANKHI
jgi:hypothetical protein